MAGRMTYSSSLISETRPLVLDTSVLINLHGCKFGERILAAIPNLIAVPEVVAEELENETSRENGEHGFLSSLVEAAKVSIVPLEDEELEIFVRLVTASPSLGDGEAATIAIAATRLYCPVIDERRGRSRAAELMSGIEPAWTLDLLLHSQALSDLGAVQHADALYFALRDARMRIHDTHCDHVVDLIGARRALDCHSLPNYKLRRVDWR